YQINFQDFNAPLESYEYSLSVPSGLTAFDSENPTAPYDYKLISQGIQIKQGSISPPLTITVANTTLSTTASFTIVTNPSP
ncbi:MAG: hypothetical protein KBT81_07505, partial [Oleispira antarctica]|nr:hypothetical protein [Oleispira antarctica]